MTTATAARRKPDPPPPVQETAAPPAAAQDGSPDLAVVVTALARITQAAIAALAADVGRGAQSRNGALVSLGAHRDDVETLRAFLAAQPLPDYYREA